MNFCSRIYNQSTIDYFLSERNRSQHAKRSPKKSGDLKASTKDWVLKSFYSSPTVSPASKKSASLAPIPATKTPSKNIPDYKGEPEIYFEQSVISSNAEKFKFCLVGKFKRSRPSLEKIREWVGKEWKPNGEWSVTLLDQTHVFVRLDNDGDMIRIWPRNRWFIQGHLMKVFKWAPTFRPSDGEPSSSAVWISLPLLPLVFFQQELLYSIASLVGRVIGMDGPTRNLSRTNVARVCMEVDLLRDLPNRVWIGTGEGGFWQDIRYQKLPSYCTGCRQQGHSLGICKFTKRDAAPCVSQDNSKFQTRGAEKEHLVAEASSQSSEKFCSVVEQEEKGKEVTEEKGECSIAQATEQILSAKCPNTVLGLSKKQGITEESGVDVSGNAEDCQGIGTEKVVSEEKVHARGKGLLEEVAVEGDEHANELGKEEFEFSSQDEYTQPEKQSRKSLKNKSDGRSLQKRSPHARKNFLLNTNLFFWKRRDIEKPIWLPLDQCQRRDIEKPSWLPLDHCRHFSLAELRQCTRNFDASLVIGRGGYGNVYEGIIAEGTKVAIKRLSQCSGQGMLQFQAEIACLSKLRYRNVVSLFGFCQEQNEMILVYEFINNGSLKDRLCNSNNPPLSWKQRLEICIGIARGLHYVHTSSIIHRDVKTCNILIDKNWDAKLCDFGLSRMVPDVDDTFTHVSTCVQGSPGYLDPEYFLMCRLTYKSDVYSFGVVLFEVLSGRPAIVDVGGLRTSIAVHALEYKRSGKLEDIVDPFLRGEINPKCLLKFVETAEKCVSAEGVGRPDMGSVVWNLEHALQLQEITSEEGAHNNSSGFTKDSKYDNWEADFGGNI